MRSETSNTPFGNFRWTLGAALATLVFFACAFAAQAGQAPAPAPQVAIPGYAPPIPDFRGFWQHGPLEELEPLPWQPAPTRHLGGAIDRADVHVIFAGDPTNPNLKPWAAEIVRQVSEKSLALDKAGEVVVTNNPQETCRPSGTPNVLLLPAPMQILQEAKQVTFLYQRDHQVRRVHLDVWHSPNPKVQPYGESVGYYDGDTLVIDTIAMTDDTPLDMYGTPHSKELHVVERWRLADPNRIEVMIHIDDPVTFHRSFDTRMFYNRNQATEITEEVCAENNRLPNADGIYSIPTARPDEPRY